MTSATADATSPRLPRISAAMTVIVADRLVPQPERGERERVPIVPRIDEKLFHDWRDGYRDEAVPEQRVAWRAGTSNSA